MKKRSSGSSEKSHRIVSSGASSGLKHATLLSRTSLEDFIQFLPDLMCIINADGNLIRINSDWTSLFGYTLDELQSRPLRDFIHPDDVEATRAAITRVGSRGSSQKFTSRFQCHDGTFKWLEWSARVEQTSGLTFCQARDITETVEIKQTLVRKEKELKSILESTGIGTVVVDGKGNIIHSNGRFAEMWAIPQKQLSIGNDEAVWRAIIDQINDPEQFQERTRDLLQQTGVSNDMVFLKDGRVYERNSFPHLIDGKIFGRSWGFYDITHRIEIERALKDSEEKFRSLAESSPNIIFINLKGKVVYVNQLCEKLIGYPLEYYYSAEFNFLSLTAPEYLELIREKYEIHRSGQELEPYEYALITRDGRKLHTVLSTKLINYGGEIAILGMITDITQRKHAEMEVARINGELIRMNATKDKFFSIIAHDLKSPFNTIFWFTNSLLKGIGSYNLKEITTQVENISNASKQAYLLVENLLLWAHSQNRTLEFHVDQINFTEHIQKNISLIKSQADKKQVTITSTIKSDYWISVDKNMIDTILRNLISNAVQFTSQNGEVSISARKVKDDLEVAVKDNGIGISKEDLSGIFTIETHDKIINPETGKGSGLGLVLCREFVEMHGGTIWVESEYGKGSTFRFTIPLKNGDKR
jgi:PAS domain S-box-containing protein